jgi:photosystem II stability/assembly factor-like uncharacterized protein
LALATEGFKKGEVNMKIRFQIFVFTAFALANIKTLNAQWVQQNSGTDATLVDVVMLDATTAIAVGRNGSILKTTNSGATWIDIAASLPSIQPWNGVSFFDTLNGIVVGDHGVVLITSNAGASWIWHNIPGEQKCLSALHLRAKIYVGTDSGKVYITSDTGRTWTSVKVSVWPIRSLFIWRGVHSRSVPVHALTPYSLCLGSSSVPWQEIILPNFQGLGSEAFDGEFSKGGGPGFIVGVQGDKRSAPTILRQPFSDIGWYEVTPGIPQEGTLLGVSAPSTNVSYVCGTNGMIYKSPNEGDTWLEQTAPTRRNMNAISFYDESRGFAVGDSGLILYTSNGGLTGIDEREYIPPAKFVLKQNYPNPLNSSTTISFDLHQALLCRWKYLICLEEKWRRLFLKNCQQAITDVDGSLGLRPVGCTFIA